MNCNNFEAIISDLAREQMLEAHTRESALSHMEECGSCAKRLRDERALTTGFRSLAASMEGFTAPASLEANLLAKFRERKVSQTTSPVVIEMPRRAARWQRFVPQAVAAAVILMFAIGGASLLRLKQANDVQKGTVAESNESNGKTTQTMPVSSNPMPAATSADEDGNATIATADSSDGDTARGQKLSPTEVAAIINGAPTARRPNYQRVPRAGIDRSVKTSPDGEIATDFIPVSYGDNLNEIDNGRIVRVEMPRSALAQFGLPVNMDRANERIMADVLIGDDGMARAIRFVR